MVTPPGSDLEHRRPVWSALSELFLDTSLRPQDLDRIAAVLARSPYSVEEIQRILLWEVYPACRSNLRWIAGEWAGFDPEWLEGRILRGQSLVGRAWTGTVGRVAFWSSVDWRRIRRRVTAIREGRRWKETP